MSQQDCKVNGFIRTQDENGCWNCVGTPILIDLDNAGFSLTGPDEGVFFNLIPGGESEKVAWTKNGTADAWLALDRNGNSQIDNGSELFGNATPQPPSPELNGFVAIAVFDSDGDNQITPADPVYSDLRLWLDWNHDAISQPQELVPLDFFGITALDLEIKTSNRRDRVGNRFRYRAAVIFDGIKPRFAYDVILQTR